METIALFGGSFDPPHIGHEAIVKKILTLNDVNKIIIMPTYLNPFKSLSHACAELRLKWLKEIFSIYKNVEVSSYEVDLKHKVATIDSVKYLLKRYKKIYLIIGADNLKSLSKWDRYEELKTLVTFVIATRDEIKIADEYIKIKIDENISSTTLREEIDKSKLSKQCEQQIVEFYKEKNAK